MGSFSFGAKYITQVRDDVESDQTVASSPPLGPSAIIPTELNGQVGQQLQKLTKRDATTRLKALQALKQLVEDEKAGVSEGDVRLLLGPWAYAFKRCVFDGNRLIRMEACHLMTTIALIAKKDLRGVLKFVYPCWYMAQFDESVEVATVARNGLTSVFPGSKAFEALLYCRVEVLSGFSQNLKATPASLGDPSKDSPEELEGRYERVLSMTALAIGGVLNDLENVKTLQVQTGVQAGRTLSTSAGVQEIYHSVRALLKDPQFTRAFFKAKYARVRQSAYELISLISRNHVTLLSDDEVVMMIAPSVLASIGEKDHAIHASMWGALLSFASSFPSAWRAIDIPKVFLPRLWSHIRHISPVSADIAFPALLPLVSVLPNATVDKLSFFKSLLSSIWDSLASVAQEGARIAAAHAWQECFLFGMEQKSIEFDELFEVVFEPLALKAAIVNGDKLARDIVLAIAGTLVKSNSRFLGTFEKGMLRVVTKAVETGLVCNDPEKLHNVSLLLFSIGMEGGLEGQLLGAGTVEQCLALLLGHIFKDNEETLRVDAMVFATSLFKMLPPGSVPEPQPPSKREDECYVQVASSDPSQTELSMVSGLMEDLASKAHSDEYLGATCDLLVSLIARLQQPSELFFSVIDQLFKSPNFGLGGASCIVQSCIEYCKTTKKSTEHLRDWTSADLDKLCVQLCSKGRVEPIGASTIDFVSRVFIGDGKTVSLLTEQGQASLLRTLLGWIEISQPHSEDVQEWDGGDSDNIINILHLILQMVVANTLAKTSTLVALQMSVLSSLFHLLLREFIVLPNSFQVDEEGNVSEDEDMFVDKDEEESNVILHRNIASQILDFWQHQEDIADVLLQASDSSHATDSFFDNIAAALLTYSSGKYHATDEQLAKCLFVLWKVLDKINGAREPIQKHWKTILLTKISTKASLQRVWTPFGRLVGYEALLSSIMSAEECHVAYTVINCLLEERKEKEIVAMDFRDDCQTSIMAYLARNAAMYINALGLAYKEGKLNVVASLLRCGLQLLPAGVSSGEQEKTGQMVVSREEGLSHIKNLKKPAETFLLDTVLCDSDVDRVVTVLEGTGRCVRCLSSAGLEKFSDFALEACRMVFDQPERADVYLRVVVACFPVDRCSLPQSKFSMQHYDSKQVLPKGSTVWYHHRQEDRWESGAKIVDVDYSAVPPSYSVDVAGGVRETERDRLSLVDPRQSPSTQSQTVDYTTLASDQERSWLMKILKLALAREDLLGLDIVLIAVAYGGRTLSRQDWESVLNFLQRSTERLVGHLCYTVLEPVCDTVMCQAKKLAETDFNSVISAVDFFSLLSRKGILHRSTANTQAVATIMKSSESDFNSYFKLHGATLSSVLSLYCHIAATVQTSPFLPIITWESIQAQICIFIMDIYILIGKVFAIMRLCTDSHYEDGSFWANVVMDVDAFSPALQQLSTVVHSIVVQADNAFMSNVMQRADGYSKFHQVMEGINGLDALVALSLLQEPHCVQNSYSPMTPVAATAHILLFHHHKMLSYLVTDLHNGNENADVAQNDALELASKGDAQEAFELAGLNRVLALVATDPHDPQFLHAWSLITGCILENTYQGRSKVQAGLIECIRELPSIVDKLFSQLIHSMDLLKTGSSKSKGFQADKTPSSGAPNVSFHGVMRDNKGVTERSPTFAAALLYGLLRAMPTVCRGWFVRLQDRATAVAIEKYISTFVSPEMIAAEFSAIEKATTEKNQGSVGDAFTVRTIPTSREVVASLKVEEGHSLDLLVRFPMTFPLKAPEASCQKSVGVGEAMLRKWLLSIMAFLRNHNGSVAEALDLWKRNAEREFSGQEDCLICYSIIQPSNGQLPKLSCRTCRKKFHGACLYKWFHSSGKSNCPHCQSPW